MTRNKSIRFGANNFLTGLDPAKITAASEMANFGKANLANVQRSKVYRTNGNFTITADNATLYFNDGTDKTAVLAAGHYSGGSALAAHAQAQLNSVSTEWTCSYSEATRKFSISRSSGTDTLRFSETASAAWDTLGYTTTVDTSAAIAGVADKARNHTEEHITFDLGTPRTVREFHIVGPLGEVFSISRAATLQLMANTLDSWDTPALTLTPKLDAGGIHLYLDDLTDTSYRYWRFRWVDRENTVGPQGFKLGHIYLGDYETVTTTNVAPGLVKRYLDPSDEAESDSGAKFFKSRARRRIFDSMTIGLIDEADERRTLEALFERVGLETPFYVCLDPLGKVSASLSEVTLYGRFEQEPRFQNIIRDVYSMNFAVEEAV